MATVRPETIFADVAVAINPNDPRTTSLQGDYVLNPLTRQPIPIIADDYVDPEFGTGLLKVTPAHDINDFKIGKQHNLPIYSTINTFGKIDLDWLQPPNEPDKTRAEMLREQFQGLGTTNARQAVVGLLQAENLVEKIDQNYTNQVAVCYKGNHPIEPLPYPNWFVRMEGLAELGLQAVRTSEVKVIPQRFTKQYEQWLSNIRDWPISRQIVWGIRMPVWYNTSTGTGGSIQVTYINHEGERRSESIDQALLAGVTLDEIRAGLQSVITSSANYVVSITPPGEEYVQSTDTFDTWFSSGQWPLAVLGYPDGPDFKRFYPTAVLDSMWDILFFWIARMIMLGKYLTNDSAHPEGVAPFKTVYLHSMVTDAKGAKMSKSKGNVVNPLEIIAKYGADALRIALVAGSAPGNPIALSEPKVKGYRNFGNKIWNIGRFIQLQEQELGETFPENASSTNLVDQEILNQLSTLVKTTTQHLEHYHFSDAALGLYDFIWNEFANRYLEENKNRTDREVYLAVVKNVYLTCLRLLHPFMPFVTEAVWQNLQPTKSMLITEPWPNS